ncbi:MAG: metal-dependent transcriptional regulator [Spirochaetales bacterium]
MVTSTVEQYIKVLFTETEHSGRQIVSMKRLSETMDVTPGTATSMAKHLAALKLVEYQPRRGCRLTDDGTQLAIRMVRRHRLIETFLERVLGYDWSEVHAEAERLEHAVTDRFIERVDTLLNYPDHDPHGDPIPAAGGELAAAHAVSLCEAPIDVPLRVVRVLDDSPRFLGLMKRYELLPGAFCRVLPNEEASDTISVRYEADEPGNTRDVSLSNDAGGRVLVVPVDINADL